MLQIVFHSVHDCMQWRWPFKENYPLFSDRCSKLNESKEATFIQDSIKKKLYDETSDMLKIENDPLAFSDDENKRTDNNEISRIYIKEDPLLAQYIKVEKNCTNNEYKYCNMNDTKQNIDIKDHFIECPEVSSNGINMSVYENCNPELSKINDGNNTTSISDYGKVNTSQKNETDLRPLYKFLMNVQTVQNDTNGYKCLKCKTSYTDNVSLRRHTNSVHRKPRNYECHICNKKFTVSCNLKMHISSKHNGIRYKGGECKRSYFYLNKLKNHINAVHLKLKDYECQFCKKTFAEPYNLKKHIRSIHENIKYKCDVCKRSYSQMDKLKIHINAVHIKYKNYECQFCNKTFTGSYNLKTHMRSIHEGIKHKCEYCNKNFAVLRNLKRHIDSIHKKNNDCYEKYDELCII